MLPVGTVPGDLPVPVVFRYQGAGSGLPNVHFGFLTSAISDGQGHLVEQGVQVLEDGSHFTDRDWHRGGVEGRRLAEAFGLGLPQDGLALDRSGAFALSEAALADLGPWGSKVSELTTATYFKVLMGQERARIYGYLDAFKAYVPILWLDRMGHWVAFHWDREQGVAGSTFTLRVTNAEGQGVQLCWADQGAADAPVDLLRVDFMGLAEPSLLVRGYPGTTASTTGPLSGLETSRLVLPAALGPVGRPTQIQVGSPGSLDLPAFLRHFPEAPGGALVPVREWRFAYAETVPTDLRSVQEPLGVTNLFTFQTYPLAGGQIRGVDQAWSEDTRSGATWSQTWRRDLPSVPGKDWTVSYHSVLARGKVTIDRHEDYTYGLSGRTPPEAILRSVKIRIVPGSWAPPGELGLRGAGGEGLAGVEPKVEVIGTFHECTGILAKEAVLVDGTVVMVRVFNYEDFIRNLEVADPKVVTVLVSRMGRGFSHGGGIRTPTMDEPGARNEIIHYASDPFAGWQGISGEGTRLDQVFSALEHAAPTQNGLDGGPGPGASGSAGGDGGHGGNENQQMIKKLQETNDAGKHAADVSAIKGYLGSMGKAVMMGASSGIKADDILVSLGALFGGPIGSVTFLGAGTLGGIVIGGFSGLVPSSIGGGIELQHLFRRNENNWNANYRAIQNYSDTNCAGKPPEIRY